MPLFHYKGKRADGESVEGDVEAGSDAAAAEQLQSEGVWLTELRPVSGGAEAQAAGGWNPWYALFPLPKSQLAALFRQLASLFQAGVPAFQAMTSVQDRVSSVRVRALVRKMAGRIAQGQPLSRLFGEHASAFGTFVPPMLEVGERTGRLDIVCNEIAEQYELEVSLSRSVLIQKLYYGGLILLAVIIFPLIAAWKNWMIARAGDNPSLAAEKVAGLWHTLFTTLAAVAAVFVVLWVLKALTTIPALEYVRDAMRLYMPLSGGVVRRAGLARFCKTAAAMYQAGVPVAEAVEAAALAMGNRLLTRRVLTQAPALREGGSVSEAAAASGLFDPTLLGMIATGEQSGALPDALYHVATEYEQRRDSGRRILIIGSIGVGLLIAAVIVGAVVVYFYSTYYGSMMDEMMKMAE